MNQKLQYASMLEIPVSTCSVSSLPKKKKFRRKKKINDELVKAELLKKVNSEQDLDENLTQNNQTSLVAFSDQTELAVQEVQPIETDNQSLEQNTSNVYFTKPKSKKTPFKFTIVGVQLAIIGVLVATIFLTNAIYKDSGINVFLRGVFGTENAVVDTREYSDFSPVISMGDNKGVVVNEGVVTFAGEGSVYAPCDGVVEKITPIGDGKYNIEIAHSQNFKSIITNVEYVYVNEGESVYRNIPVGYLEPDGATICFVDSQGELLDDYSVVDNVVVWQA